jgi:hypothetical protein
MKFNTTKIHALVTNITQHSSAFAINQEGDSIFITNNLSRFLSLKVGDTVFVEAVINHPDKRDTIKWRAVGCIKSPPVIEPEEPDDEEEEALGILNKMIKDAKPKPTDVQTAISYMLNNAETYLTSAEIIAGYREAQPSHNNTVSDKDINNAARRLFDQGSIAKAEVWARPDQRKASFNLWAISTDRFTA